MAKCKWCGKEFERGLGILGPGVFYCSKKCKTAHEKSKK